MLKALVTEARADLMLVFLAVLSIAGLLSPQAANTANGEPPGRAVPASGAPTPGSQVPNSAGNEPVFKLNIQPDDAAPKSADARKPIPSNDAIKTGKAMVQEVYGAEIASAKVASKKLPLIKKLLEYAQKDEAGSAPAELYALLDQARELAVGAGDVGLAIQAIEALDVHFNVDGGAMKSQTLTTMSEAATTTIQNKAVATAALAVFEQAMASDDMNTARTTGAIALNAARKAKDDALSKSITERAKYFKAKQTAYEKVPAALATLQSKPDDGAANLVVGRYYCFIQENWHRGLPLLALSSDPALQKLATLETNGDQAHDVRMQVADSWWQRGEEEPDFKTALQAHAAEIYRDVLPKVSGLSKIKIEKRLEAAAATAAAAPSPASIASAPSAPSVAAERDALWKKIQELVKANQVTRTKEAGFTLGRTPYAVIPEDGAMLVGFDLSIGSRGIEAVCPLFLRRTGNQAGAVIGKPTPGQVIRVMAKKGYGVASLKVKAGLWVDGLSVTFMEMKGQGLDPSTAYTSPWYGSSGGRELELGDSTIVVGIHGHGKPGELSSIGLVQLGAATAEN